MARKRAVAGEGDPSMSLTYLDANVVIAVLEGGSPSATEAVAQVETGRGRLAVSPLVLAECLVGPLRARDTAREAHLRAWIARAEMLELAPEAWEDAAALTASHGVELKDALHLATALWHGCERLLTFDRKLALAAGPHIDIIVLR